MSKYKKQGFSNTFKNAQKGFRLALKSERNIRIHIAVATIVLISGAALHFDVIKYCLLLFAIALVIVSEMLNSAIEFTLDSYYHNKYNKMVGMAKDISAGAVMIATFTSITIGLLIFGHSLFKIFN